MSASARVVAIGCSARALHDRARDVAREALLAERRDDDRRDRAPEAAFTRSAALGPSPPMRMSSGPSLRNEKPRSGLIELHRGDAEIEQDAVDRLVTEAARDVLEIGEAILDQRQPALRPASTSAKPPAIASRSRSMPMTRVPPTSQDRARVSAGAERAVDIDAAIARPSCSNDLAGEHGNMTGQSASDSAFAVAARHHSRALCASCAATREPSCFFNARTVPVASASCARKRPGSQI